MTEQEKLTAADYIYRGDKQTSETLRNADCSAVRRHDGKCIRGKNGSMLVSFNGKQTVIIGRLLRRIDKVQKRSSKRQDPKDKVQKSKIK